MKIFTRFLIVLLAGITLIISFSFATEIPAATLHVIGVTNDYPMMFSDRNGQPSGLVVDLLRSFSNEYGYSLTIELLSASQMGEFFSRDADIYYDGGYSVAPESLHATIPFYIQNYHIFSDYRQIEYLGHDILFQQVSNSFEIAYKFGNARQKYFEKIGGINHLVPTEFNDQIIDLWIRGEIDAMILPDEIGMALIKARGIENVGHATATIFLEDNSFWLKPEQYMLQFELNSFIQENMKNGELQSLIKTWIYDMTLLPPRSISLSLINYFFLITAIATFGFSYRSYHLERSVKVQSDALIELNKDNEELWKTILVEERYKNEYLINLSHELRTPISLILNAVNAVEQAGPAKSREDATMRFFKYTGIAKTNSLRLLKVINNLIDSNLIEHKSYILDFRSLDLVYEINELIKSIQESLTIEALQLNFISSVNSLYADVDPYEFDRILLNIISNAIKYNDNTPRVEIHLNLVDAKILIEIIDNSLGIPVEMQEKAFLKYRQIESELTKKSEGAGFGLYLSKSLVMLHNGDFEILKPTNGKGMHYLITLPIENISVEKSPSSGKSLFYDRDRLVKLELSEINFSLNS